MDNKKFGRTAAAIRISHGAHLRMDGSSSRMNKQSDQHLLDSDCKTPEYRLEIFSNAIMVPLFYWETRSYLCHQTTTCGQCYLKWMGKTFRMLLGKRRSVNFELLARNHAALYCYLKIVLWYLSAVACWVDVEGVMSQYFVSKCLFLQMRSSEKVWDVRLSLYFHLNFVVELIGTNRQSGRKDESKTY